MTPSSAALKSNTPARRSLWIPGLFVLGFLIVIAVNGVLIYTSISSFSGLETDGAYERGLHYNQSLALAAANAETGWHAEPKVSDAGNAARKLEITVTDRTGAPVTELQVEAYLVRPTNAGMDDTLALTDLGNGRYAADFTPKAMGNWELRLQAKRGDVTWQQVQRIYFR
ncbi:MAG: FixH family protein [Proteobacteria bacterium]|nr:FixH family protein [Pseudomonadota bacterium]